LLPRPRCSWPQTRPDPHRRSPDEGHGDVLVAVLHREVGDNLALENVGRCRAEVEALVRVVVEARRGVGRRELHDTGTGDLVDDALGDVGRRGPDDNVGVLREKLVHRRTGDVRCAVTGVGVDLDDLLAIHATGRVDLVDGCLDSGELRGAEEGEVASLRKKRADGQGAITLGSGLGTTVGLLVRAGIGTTAACSEHQRCGSEHRGNAPGASRANH